MIERDRAEDANAIAFLVSNFCNRGQFFQVRRDAKAFIVGFDAASYRRARSARKRAAVKARTVNAETGSDGTLTGALTEALQVQFEVAGQPAATARRNAEHVAREFCQNHAKEGSGPVERLLQLLA